MTFRLFPLPRTEVSRRLGQAHVAPEGDVRGGAFSDVVIAGADRRHRHRGRGTTSSLVPLGTGRMHDGGTGADTYGLTGGASGSARATRPTR